MEPANLTSLLAVGECLKRNRDVETKLADASRVVQARLDLLRIRIREINETIHMPIYKVCGLDGEIDAKIQFISEWNDTNGCPPNADTIAKHLQTGVPYHPTQLQNNQTDIWTRAQSRSLCSTIHKLEVEERVKEYSEKKYELEGMTIKNTDLLKISALKNDVAEFDLNAVKTKPLEELVATGKGIYDWEKVSNDLQRSHTPLECKTRWFQYLHPSINKSTWSEEEDLRLLEIAERWEEQDWEAIAAELATGRSAYSCFTAYQSRLRGMDVGCATDREVARVRIVDCAETGLTRIARSAEAGWTRDDDCALAAAVTKSQGVNGIAWSQVMDAFPHKSRKQLFARWSQVLDPTLRRGKLTYVEQKAIVIGTRRFGLDFGKIRNKLVPHRTISQIRHYTLYRINNCSGRGKWTLFAEQVFRALIEFLGPGCWREVRSYFPYNSVVQIKRRYQMLLGSQAANIYILPKQVRVSLSEPDMETCKLIDNLEKIKPLGLNRQPAPLPPVRPPITVETVETFNTVVDCDASSSDGQSEVEADEDSNRDKDVQSSPSVSEKPPRDPLQEECVVGSSKENEEMTDDDESDDISVPLGCKPRRGRPPSKKKKKERTKPKRSYVRSGQYKIAVDENSETKRSLRSKS